MAFWGRVGTGKVNRPFPPRLILGMPYLCRGIRLRILDVVCCLLSPAAKQLETNIW